MEGFHIKDVTLADIPVLQTIGQQTFAETFTPHNSAENMAQYLAEGFSPEKLASELSNDDSLFFFAQQNDEVIGYLKINLGTAQTELQEDNGLEIERIYVLQAYHGQKVGQLLYDWALQIARDQQMKYLWLGVWEHNAKAIRFYEKNGFVPFDKHVFKLGDDIQTDIMMKKNLQ